MNKQVIRYQILTNALELPNIKGLQVTKPCKRMFKAMFNRYITRGAGEPTSMTYWAEQIANPKLHNQLLRILSDGGWITVSTRPNNNWSEAYINESKLLEYVTREELDRTRMYHKFSEYRLSLHDDFKPYPSNVTSVRGKSEDTGLNKPGFAKSGKVKYSFDTTTMFQHKDFVVAQINKGIDKMITKYPQIIEDHANYRELGLEVVESYLHDDKNLYNAGPNRLDQRGRNIRGDLSKIGNPVGFKIMRALLVIPAEYRQTATVAGLRNKYLFIAELMGFKSGTTDDKVAFGRKCYWTRAQHESLGDDEVIENIWAMRTYADIDQAFPPFVTRVLANRALEGKLNFPDPAIQPHKWTVPVEIDMSALTY